MGPEPEPLWQRISPDGSTVTEVLYVAGGSMSSGSEPWHTPVHRHFIIELLVSGQRRDLRVLKTKREALLQAMAWYRQYESPYYRLAMRLHVPDALARQGVLGLRLPSNGQSAVCELFAFYSGDAWIVLINADNRPILTREHRTEEAAMLDAWGLAWKLQGHALPWPASWIPAPPIVLHAMARYDRVPTIGPLGSEGRDEDASVGTGDGGWTSDRPGIDDGGGSGARLNTGWTSRGGDLTTSAIPPTTVPQTAVLQTAVLQTAVLQTAVPRYASAGQEPLAPVDDESGPKRFKLLHFAPVPDKIVRRRRPIREL
jgi:hypothetical protein